MEVCPLLEAKCFGVMSVSCPLLKAKVMRNEYPLQEARPLLGGSPLLYPSMRVCDFAEGVSTMKRQMRDGRKAEVSVVGEKRGVVEEDVVDGGTGTNHDESGKTGNKHTVYCTQVLVRVVS